jgi:hypothetical protein
LAALLVATAFATAIACSSSGDDTANPPAEGGIEAAGNDGLPLDEFDLPDADEGGDPSFDDFEDPGGCGGWQPEDAVLNWRPVGAHGSRGSCEVCVTDAGGTMYKLVIVPAGNYELDALVSREDGGVGDAAWTTSLAFETVSGDDAGFATKSGPMDFSFGQTSMTAKSDTTARRVVMRISSTDDCFLADDIRLYAR